MKKGLIISLLAIILFTSCKNGKRRLDVDVSKTGMTAVKIHRYDVDLFKVDPADLQRGLAALRPQYPFFLDTDLNDTAKLNSMLQYLSNPRTREFHEAVTAKYQNLDALEKQLDDGLRHLVYYFPKFRVPRIYTYISGGDYQYPVQFADSVMLIGLDNYLGKDFKPYLADGVPAYRVARMDAANILPDCMNLLVKIIYPEQIPGNNLLEQIVDAGKRIYLLDALIPAESDMLKIGYNQLQYNWIVKNEKHVWSAVVGNNLLYSSDGKMIRSFLSDGPFTSEFSKDAPPRLGEWLGWRIVSGYMESHPEVTLNSLMGEKDAQKILSMSGFKPGD